MSFFSSEFFIFWAILVFCYFLCAKVLPSAQWIVLLIASYFFYGYSSPKFVIFLLFSTISTWYTAVRLARLNTLETSRIDALKQAGTISREGKSQIRKEISAQKQKWLILCLFCNLAILCSLKLFTLIPPQQTWAASWLVLPLGISYYTFQSIGYCIDVYRGMAEAERSFFKYALYVSYFPQISQGPIGRYGDLAPQLFSTHHFEYTGFVLGLERVAWGFFKKLVVANNLAVFVNHVYGQYNSFSGMVLLLATVLYGLQLYADFSGYMDIALGFSEIFGIRLAENFKTPYFSKTITEFWRRWHISLGAWFRDYLYYSLLRSSALSKITKALSARGNKKIARNITTSVALFVTWITIGFWHGVSLNFILYGLFHGTFIILAVWMDETWGRVKGALHIQDESKWFQCFQILRTYLIVNLGYVLFRASDFSSAIEIYHCLFTNFDFGIFRNLKDILLASGLSLRKCGETACSMLLCLVVEFIEASKTKTDMSNAFPLWFHRWPTVLRWPILYILLGIIMYYLFEPSTNNMQFIYFNF